MYKTMKAPLFMGNYNFVYKDIPIPEISENEVLLEMKACGLCGTDLHKIRHNTVKPGTVLGHEITGIIAKTGKNVKDFKEGDRVFVAHHVPCFSCNFCSHGNYSLCRNFKTSNIHPGGFAPFIRIPEENVKHSMLKIPESLSFEHASLAEPLACCIHSIPRLNLHPGDNVVIIGSGSIGLLYLQLVQNHHLCSAFITDINQLRLDKAAEMGGITINSSKENSVGKIMELTEGKGANAIIITVPLASLFSDAMGMVTPGGVILSFAPLAKEDKGQIDLTRICTEEITVTGAYSSKPFDYKESLELLNRGYVNPEYVISHIMLLEQFEKAVEMAMEKNTKALKIVLKP